MRAGRKTKIGAMIFSGCFLAGILCYQTGLSSHQHGGLRRNPGSCRHQHTGLGRQYSQRRRRSRRHLWIGHGCTHSKRGNVGRLAVLNRGRRLPLHHTGCLGCGIDRSRRRSEGTHGRCPGYYDLRHNVCSFSSSLRKSTILKFSFPSTTYRTRYKRRDASSLTLST